MQVTNSKLMLKMKKQQEANTTALTTEQGEKKHHSRRNFIRSTHEKEMQITSAMDFETFNKSVKEFVDELTQTPSTEFRAKVFIPSTDSKKKCYKLNSQEDFTNALHLIVEKQSSEQQAVFKIQLIKEKKPREERPKREKYRGEKLLTNSPQRELIQEKKNQIQQLKEEMKKIRHEIKELRASAMSNKNKEDAQPQLEATTLPTIPIIETTPIIVPPVVAQQTNTPTIETTEQTKAIDDEKYQLRVQKKEERKALRLEKKIEKQTLKAQRKLENLNQKKERKDRKQTVATSLPNTEL